MILYLLRHADAEIMSYKGDRGRALTDKGREQAKVAGRFLKTIKPGVVLISTFDRTKETLDLIQQQNHWDKCREFVSVDVAPSGNIDDLLIEILEYKEDSLLVVGHNPQLSNLIYHLTNVDVSMHNCSFAEIDLDVNKLKRVVHVEDMVCMN